MSDADEKAKFFVRRGRQRVRARVTWDDDVDAVLTEEFGDIERPLTAVQCPTVDGSISIRIIGIDEQAIRQEEYARQGRSTVRFYGTAEVFDALMRSPGNPVLIRVEHWRGDACTRGFHLTKVTPLRQGPSGSSEEWRSRRDPINPFSNEGVSTAASRTIPYRALAPKPAPQVSGKAHDAGNGQDLTSPRKLRQLPAKRRARQWRPVGRRDL